MVTLRDIASASGVSPALVVRHYGSKDGLRQAVDEHVARVFETLLGDATSTRGTDAFDQAALPSLAEAVAAHLSADSAIPTYLGRMLLDGGPVGNELFRRLYALSRDALAALEATGSAHAGPDPEVRAAFLLVNDLAVLILRDRLFDVLGVDPLSAAGMRRWGAEAFSIYRDGLGGAAPEQA